MVLDKLCARFLKSIGCEECDELDLTYCSCVRSSLDENYYTVTFKKETCWDFETLKRFMNCVARYNRHQYRIIFIYNENVRSEKLSKLIDDWYFNNAHEEMNFQVSFSKDIANKDLTLIFNTIIEEQNFVKKYMYDFKEFLSSITFDFFIKTINLEKHLNSVTTDKDDYEKTNKEEIFEEVKKKTEEEISIELEKNYQLMINERRNFELFKKGDYQTILISQINSNSGAVDINGKVFEVNSRDTRNGKLLSRIGIDDGSDAIYVTLISNETSLKREQMLEINPGNNIRIKGRVGIDKYRQDTMVMGHYFSILPPDPLRDDLSKEKRVELHLHTKMSEMDGVSFFKDYVQLAKHMGHTAIAITDHGNVQGFPDAQAAVKKANIKGLYGSELYVIDDFLHAAINPNDQLLKEANFVCLDTETTGLSSKYDRITEFGAVRVVKGIVQDRLDILINPEMPIPVDIQEITSITDEMVKNQPTIKEALPRILEYMKGFVMVSHNIDFDYGMINESMKRSGFGELKIPGIDTLALSRYLFPENKHHSLGALCKRFEVNYEDDKAHRADYDAEVLSNIWMVMRVSLSKDNPDIKVSDLSNLPLVQEGLKNYQNNFHTVVLAKNDKGIKDLYKIISDAHINKMGLHPFTTKSYLNAHRSNLLVGSSCFNGEVFVDAMIRGDDVLRDAIKQFDYIEIQPLENYSWLIHMRKINSVEHLKEIIKTIIRISEEEGKIIVATGDCHYCNPNEKIYRDIIISAQQVGGINHPLNSYDRAKYPIFENPDQHYRSTEEMLEAFKWLGEDKAFEYVVTNTNKIADMIDNIVPVKTATYTPKIPNSEKLLSDLVYGNAHKLYGDNLPKLIEDRIKSELDGIINNGYSVIYYIAYELVKKANDDGYIVGSRGSVGSSLVATLANITEVNPLPPHYRCPKCRHVEFYGEDTSMSGFDLPDKNCPLCGTKMIADGQSIPFQTFLGFNADKTPDIDLNFATDYQSRAHEYTKVLLGASNVFRAGTISTVQFKTAYGYVRKYFEKYLGIDPNSIHGSRVASLAYGCTEIKKTTGQHPAGIVVVPNDYEVYDFTPIQYPADNVDAAWKTTHFDFKSMHDTLLKLDILGHVDPQALKMMCDLTHINVNDIPINDKKVLSLFTTDDALNLMHRYMPKDNGALGLPEFGTDFVRQVLRDSQPKTFKDLVIISGLTHGTDVWNNNAQELIKSKTTDLNGVIGCRDDIMTYLISKGIDKHNAFVIMETVRKKEKQLSAEQIKDMLDHNVPDYYIESCKKIKYLFPKGHATAYVIMAIRVAYFKIYYPLEYYATFFTLRSDEYDIGSMVSGINAIHEKLEDLYNRRVSKNPESKLTVKENAQITTLEVALEMEERGFKIENISLEKSDSSLFIVDKENNGLIPPFKVIDGVGVANGEALVKARQERMFSSKEDLLKRGGLSSPNVNTLEKLGVLKNLKETEQLSLFDFKF